MLKTFGDLVVDGRALAEGAPVWLESALNRATGDDWQGTILLGERPKLASGSHMLLLLEDGRQAEVVLTQMHPGADGGLLVRFESSDHEG
jgi:hypothetical protein